MTSLKTKKILVVDDEELLREILMEELSYYGAEVIGAENGTIAFDLVKNQKFDAVITDVRMPGGNGIVLIKNINEYFKKDKPKLFICSGYNDITSDEIDSMNITHTFNKPFDRENFIQVICDSLIPV